MNGWLKWLPWVRKPVFVPGPEPSDAGRVTAGYKPCAMVKAIQSPHIVHAPELFECDCGRAHPVGWVCASAYRDQM